MSNIRKPIDAQAASLMLLLCLLWGAQQPIIKSIAQDISPMMQIALRSGIGAVLIALVMLRQRVSFALHKGPWQAGLLAGGLFAVEFIFIGEGLRYTSASHLVVFLYTAPIFTALGLHWLLPQERLTYVQWFGIALSFSGISLAFVSGLLVPNWNSEVLIGDTFALGAGLFWGLTTVALRCTKLNQIPATQTTQYQLLSAFFVLLVACAFMDQLTIHWTPTVIAAISAQGILIAFFSLLVWFWLLTTYKASQLASFSFLTPVFGVMFGVMLLGEPLEINFVIGSVLVVLGVAIVNRPRSKPTQNSTTKE